MYQGNFAKKNRARAPAPPLPVGPPAIGPLGRARSAEAEGVPNNIVHSTNNMLFYIEVQVRNEREALLVASN
jgi:hypothetical protein